MTTLQTAAVQSTSTKVVTTLQGRVVAAYAPENSYSAVVITAPGIQVQLNNKDIYVMDGYCGANEDTRLKIRFVTEVAWQAHFVKNMFIRPSDEEVNGFEPDFVVLNSCKTVNPNWKEQGLHSENYVAFNLTERMALIGGTWYGGEMKKGIFSVMNYYLPLKGIAAMHCSANQGKAGDTAIFFGLSGTGKTTLSTDPNRALIGDDERQRLR